MMVEHYCCGHPHRHYCCVHSHRHQHNLLVSRSEQAHQCRDISEDVHNCTCQITSGIQSFALCGSHHQSYRLFMQAVYTAGVVVPRPVSDCRYLHYSPNPKKFTKVGFSHLDSRMAMRNDQVVQAARPALLTRTGGAQGFEDGS